MKAARPGSEGGPAQQCAGPTRHKHVADDDWADTCIYAHRPIMRSGGVVSAFCLLSATCVDVPLNIIVNVDTTIAGATMQDPGRPAGHRHMIAPMVIDAASLAFGPEMRSVDVHPRGRDFCGSTRRSRLPRAVDYVQQ